MQKRTLAPKLVAGALIFSLSTTALPSFMGVNTVTAVAAASYTSEDAFAFDAATGCITAYKGADRIVNIPEEIDDATVTGIEWGAFSDTDITKVTMPSYVTAIGSMAFEGCKNLTSIEISDNVTVIAPYTFYGCTELTEVTLPSSATRIMLEAFGGCTKLAKITIPSGVTEIDDDAFLACEKLTISGEKGSYAEAYAKKADLTFEEVKTSDADDKNDNQTGEDNKNNNQNGEDNKNNQTGEDNKNNNQNGEDNKNNNQSGEDGKNNNQSGEDNKNNNQTGEDDNKNNQSGEDDRNNTPEDGDDKNINPEDDNKNALAAAKDKAAASAVTNQIAQLGTISTDSKALLDSVRAAYNALTYNQKLLVTNYEVLTNAETSYAKLVTTQNPQPANSVVLSLDNFQYTLYTKGKRNVSLQPSVNGIAVSASDITWASSNTQVASINNGRVTAKKPGTATITASYQGVTTQCVITVKKPTLKLQKKKVTLTLKKNFKIKATAVPAAKITYKSNNKKVATVSKSGKITTKSRGKAKITVIANGVKKRITVTVK